MPKIKSENKKSFTDNNPDSHNPITYECFAPYYDNYMRHVDYDKWTDKILTLYTQHTSRELKDVMELACGTANISERLVQRGYHVTASDLSLEMLKYASQKKFKPVLMQADMTSELPQYAFDLVILAFDSINYLIDPNDISKMLDNVYNSLRTNGIFIFDISTYKNSQDNFNDYINLDESPEYVLIHRAKFEKEKRLQQTHITIFKKSDNHYIKMDEKHCQRVYYVLEILQLVENSRLECVGIYNLHYEKNLLKLNNRKLDHQFSRLFFALKKI